MVEIDLHHLHSVDDAIRSDSSVANADATSASFHARPSRHSRLGPCLARLPPPATWRNPPFARCARHDGHPWFQRDAPANPLARGKAVSCLDRLQGQRPGWPRRPPVPIL